jgi:hypothetical protein
LQRLQRFMVNLHQRDFAQLLALGQISPLYPISNCTCFLRAFITHTSDCLSTSDQRRIFCYERQPCDRARVGRFRLLYATGNESGAC